MESNAYVTWIDKVYKLFVSLYIGTVIVREKQKRSGNITIAVNAELRKDLEGIRRIWGVANLNIVYAHDSSDLQKADCVVLTPKCGNLFGEEGDSTDGVTSTSKNVSFHDQVLQKIYTIRLNDYVEDMVGEWHELGPLSRSSRLIEEIFINKPISQIYKLMSKRPDDIFNLLPLYTVSATLRNHPTSSQMLPPSIEAQIKELKNAFFKLTAGMGESVTIQAFNDKEPVNADEVIKTFENMKKIKKVFSEIEPIIVQLLKKMKISSVNLLTLVQNGARFLNELTNAFPEDVRVEESCSPLSVTGSHTASLILYTNSQPGSSQQPVLRLTAVGQQKAGAVECLRLWALTYLMEMGYQVRATKSFNTFRENSGHAKTL